MIRQAHSAFRFCKRVIAITAIAAALALPHVAAALDDSDNWRNLTPKQREDVLRNYQRWRTLPPQDKDHLQQEFQRWRNLPKDERDRLRKRYDKLSPEEQRNLRNNYNGNRRWQDDRRD
jgi:Protein of unknown function (DUF3106)